MNKKYTRKFYPKEICSFSTGDGVSPPKKRCEIYRKKGCMELQPRGFGSNKRQAWVSQLYSWA